jgi:NADH-quinone oxidoreductase subunit E
MTIKLSDAAENKAEEFKKRYPQAQSAVMPLLYIAQEELGSITNDAVTWVANKLSMPPVQVMEVATFYTMYYKKAVGKYHVQVCRTLSCALCGGKKLLDHLRTRLGIEPGEISKDGTWSYEEVECLGSCGTAPMAEINDHYFENLSAEKLEALMQQIEKEKPDLRYSTVREQLGAGLSGHTKSEVI